MGKLQRCISEGWGTDRDKKGWFVASGFIMVVGLAMSDLGNEEFILAARHSLIRTRECHAYIRRSLLLE